MSSCLSSEQIERFVAGDLGTEEASACAEHIATCEKCGQAVEAHRSSESMLKLLRTEHAAATHSLGPSDQPSVRPSSGVEATFPKIEGYHIVGVLGQGGMGIVYRAVQTKLSRTVALKVLPAVVGTANPSAVERFKREATAAAQLHHTNIVPIYDFGESRDAYYYAMELIEGQPLDVVIKRLAAQNAPGTSPVQFAQLLKGSTAAVDDFEIVVGSAKSTASAAGSGSAIGSSSTGRGRAYYRQVAHWMADAAEALHFAHDQNIIHRDIKPANFLITMDHRIMVADFGLAKTAGERSVTMTGSLIGTLRYMSPEQAMAKRVRLDHRTDIYSLGVTMYELLTFQPAFPGNDEKEILGSIIAREPTSARKIDPHVPRELETICFKAMEKLPDARYDTARAMADDLRRWGNDEPIQARRPSPFQRASKFLRRHKAVFVTASVLLACVATLWFLVRAYESSRARDLIDEAQKAYLAGDDVGAATLAFEALKFSPDDEAAKRLYDTAMGSVDIMELPWELIITESGLKRARQLTRGGLVTGIPEDSRAEGLINFGIEAYGQENLPRAERAYKLALQIQPDNFRGVANYAMLKKEQYRNQPQDERDRSPLDQSLTLYETAFSLIEGSEVRPDRLAGLYNAYSTSLYMANRLSEAEKAARKAIELDRGNYSALSNLAKILTLQGRVQEAYDSAAEGARLTGGQTQDTYAAPVWRSLGTFQLFYGDDQAIDSLETSLFHKSTGAATWRLMARGLLTLESEVDPTRALAAARKADQLSEGKEPKDKRILALASLRNELWARSIAAAAAAIALGDMPTINHIIQAVSYARQGQLEAAREQLEAANTDWPEDLSTKGDVTWTVDAGVIWFETADELIALRDEAESLIRDAASRP